MLDYDEDHHLECKYREAMEAKDAVHARAWAASMAQHEVEGKRMCYILAEKHVFSFFIFIVGKNLISFLLIIFVGTTCAYKTWVSIFFLLQSSVWRQN